MLSCHARRTGFAADSLKQGAIVYFPPKIDDLLAWSTLFRSPGTWANYCGYVRTGCLLVKAPTEVRDALQALAEDGGNRVPQVFRHPAVKRAKASIRNFGNFQERERLWIRRRAVAAL